MNEQNAEYAPVWCDRCGAYDDHDHKGLLPNSTSYCCDSHEPPVIDRTLRRERRRRGWIAPTQNDSSGA